MGLRWECLNLGLLLCSGCLDRVSVVDPAVMVCGSVPWRLQS